MRYSIVLLLLFLLGLLTTACSGLTFAPSTPPTLMHGLRVLLVPTTGTATQADLGATQGLLSQRLAAFGLKEMSVQELTTGSQPTLKVEVPHFGRNERAVLDILLNTGMLEFWYTGPSSASIGSTLTPSQFAQYNPGGKAAFTGNDLDSSRVSVGTDQAGRPDVVFEMEGDAVGRFGQFTQQNVGDYLTVTLDRKVIESAVLQSAITGQGEITGNFTRQNAAAIASVLKYPSLPVTLRITGESSF